MGLWGALFRVWGGEFINQTVSLLNGVNVTVEIKEWLELDWFLFFLKVGEDALENIWSIVGTHVNSDGDIFDVGKKTIALDETHFWIGWGVFDNIIWFDERNLS